MPKFVLLWTDIVVLALVFSLAWYVWHLRRQPNLRANWKRVFQNTPAMCSAVIIAVGLLATVLDSVHFRPRLATAGTGAQVVAYDTRTVSVFDTLVARLYEMRESSYSVPLAYQSFTKESVRLNGEVTRMNPRLEHAGRHLKDPATEWLPDLLQRVLIGLACGAVAALLLSAMLIAAVAKGNRTGLGPTASRIWRRETDMPWRAALVTVGVLALLAGPVVVLMQQYHVLGTDRTGNDVLLQSLKSIRTAFVIGTLSTLATLPLAVGLGIMAGYFKGWVDELIQYLYTTLSSVPNVLLIAACVLMVQVYMDKHPELFETGAERSDLRLFLLCVILGLTGWAGLCRLLRAETLKLRELDYVAAANAFGVSAWRIMARHIFPNVVHLMLITTVLDFCGLILYEAVLSYVGVGVDPSMNSFGGMINLARTEMSRDPVVWWSFASAFTFMVALVLAANLFADGVQEAFDPRARVFRPKLIKQPKAA
jgi:peptide/nickel transport system permease protein